MRLISGNAPWQRLIRTPTFRYSVAFAVLISIVAMMLFSTLYLSVYQTLQNEIKERLTTEMVYHHDYFSRYHKMADFKANDIAIKLIYDNDLSPTLRKSKDFHFYKPHTSRTKPYFTRDLINELFDKHYLIVQPVTGERFIVIGKTINDTHFRNTMVRISLVMFLMTLALLVLLSYLVGFRELRAVDYIRKTANSIMDGDLSRRIHTNARQKGEIRQLSSTLNEMLERNEQLVTELQQVTSNIAHDLKNPLNRQKSRMEVALLKDRDSEYYQQTLIDSIADTDELLRIFNALLSIAKINTGKDRQDFDNFNLSEELTNLTELFEYEAEDKSQIFTCNIQPELFVFGHRSLLIQAVSNLLHNAIKYTPPKGNIALVAYQQLQHIVIEVTDNGTGIPDELKDQVFKRFYRLDASRHLPGTGLGLSLVKSIVDLHKANISLANSRINDTTPGLKVTITLQANISRE